MRPASRACPARLSASGAKATCASATPTASTTSRKRCAGSRPASRSSARQTGSGSADSLRQDPQLPDRQVDENPEEGGRVLLIDPVPDALQDPAEDEEAERRPR